MKISFPHQSPRFDGAALTVAFDALVDGQPRDCAVSAEALQDHFDAASPLEDELVAAFKRHRKKIEQACREALHDSDGQAVKLTSGFFRIRSA